MIFFQSVFSVVAISLILGLVGHGNAHARDITTALHDRDSSAFERQLSASSRKGSLAKRYNEFITTKRIDLTYSEAENEENEHNFVAHVYAESNFPVLLLEDFDHLAADIICQPHFLKIDIHSDVQIDSARVALRNLEDGGLIVTSHYGCNDRGERKVLRVGTVDMRNDSCIVTLQTENVSWKEAFKSVLIEMYHTEESHVFRPHEELRRREDASPTSTADSSQTFAIPIPTTTSNTSTSHLDLSHSLPANQNLLPANSSVQVTCKNCSTFGTLDFSFAAFEFDFSFTEFLEDPTDLGDFLTGGVATIVANGVGAIVDLYTNVSAGDGVTLNLFEIPLGFALAILGIGSVGIQYVPALSAQHNLNGSIGFEYGFAIEVPNGSEITVDLTNQTNSSVSGFGETGINALPFQATVNVDAAQLNFALRHQVEIGFLFDKFDAGASVGVYFDLPGLEVDISHVSDVDENCTTLSLSHSKDKTIAQQVLTDVYLLKPTVDWGVGVFGEAHAIDVPFSFGWSIINGTIATLGSSCLNFDEKTDSYVPAAEVVKNAAQNNLRKSAAGRVQTPYVIPAAFVGGIFVFLL